MVHRARYRVLVSQVRKRGEAVQCFYDRSYPMIQGASVSLRVEGGQDRRIMIQVMCMLIVHHTRHVPFKFRRTSSMDGCWPRAEGRGGREGEKRNT